MKKIYLFILILFTSASLFSQPWSVKSNGFEFSMNITGKVKIDKQFVEEQNCWLGAFVGEECRGIVKPIDIGDNNFLFFLTIYSNVSSGEVVEFKFYNTLAATIEFTQEVVFIADAIYGNPSDLFLWTSPQEFSLTGFVNFSSENQMGTALINSDEKTIAFEVDSLSNLKNIIAVFEIPVGAKAFVNGVLQQSGITANDFSNPVIYTIKGIDGKESKWTVTGSIYLHISDLQRIEISVYPNPAKDIVFYSIYGNAKIYNSIGVLVLETSEMNNQIDISNLETGIYFIEIINSENKYFSKILKN